MDEFNNIQKKQRLHTILLITILVILLFTSFINITNIFIAAPGLIVTVDVPIDITEIPEGYDDLTVPIPDNPDLNEKLETSKMCINMNSPVVFSTATSNGYLAIKNDSRNNYPQFVTITLDSNDTPVYQTGLIAAGECILYDTLDIKLPSGSHECTATFTQVNPDTNGICGQAAAKIMIVINE